MGLYPEPKHFKPQQYKVTIHQRSRIVIQQPTEEDAMELAERLSGELTCDVESFVAFVDDAANENRGEIVIARKLYPCKAAATMPTTS